MICLRRIIFAFFLFIILFSSISFAANYGKTTIYCIVPCSSFTDETNCTNAGCFWCSGACQSTSCVIPAPETGIGHGRELILPPPFNFSVYPEILEIESFYLDYESEVSKNFSITNLDIKNMFPKIVMFCGINNNSYHIDLNSTYCIKNFCNIEGREIIVKNTTEEYIITCNIRDVIGLAGIVEIHPDGYETTKFIEVYVRTDKEAVFGRNATPERISGYWILKDLEKNTKKFLNDAWNFLDYKILCLNYLCSKDRLLMWEALKNPINLKIYVFEGITVWMILIIVAIIVSIILYKRFTKKK